MVIYHKSDGLYLLAEEDLLGLFWLAWFSFGFTRKPALGYYSRWSLVLISLKKNGVSFWYQGETVSSIKFLKFITWNA